MLKIGVFDSGVGGKSVSNAIRKALPGLEVMYKNDSANIPYGDKAPSELQSLVLPILQQMVAGGCSVIVIACNTVSTTIIDKLSSKIAVPLIGMEPMVGLASSKTKSGAIAVCATPTTLASFRYQQLKHLYAQKVKVIEPDCKKWAYMIEHNQIDEQMIIDSIESVCRFGADIIVLGCTHYHWIEKLIKKTAGSRAEILYPEPIVIGKLIQVLKDLTPSRQI